MSQYSQYPLVRECPGEFRVPDRRIWFVKQGETAEMGTYCSVCVQAGCAGIEESKGSDVILAYANCDCPNPQQHYTPEQLCYPTRTQNQIYADYLKTQAEIRALQDQLEPLQSKLQTCYSKQLIELFQDPTKVVLDPKPLAQAKLSLTSYRYWSDDCGCLHWSQGEWSDVATWPCRWHLWKTFR